MTVEGVSTSIVTTPCKFVAILTVTTMLRCCAVHGSLMLQWPIRPPLQYFSCTSTAPCNNLSAIATIRPPLQQFVHHCNNSSTIATIRPPLQQFVHHCNNSSTIATIHPPLQHPGSPLQRHLSACTCLATCSPVATPISRPPLQHDYVFCCNTFPMPDLSAIAT